MADYNNSLPVKTETNGDVVVKIVDGTTNSQTLSIDASGKLTIKLNDGNGSSITLGQKVITSSVPVVIASDQTTIPVSQSGTWTVNAVPVDGIKNTYSASVLGLIPAATPTDVFTLTGSNTKTIRVTKISFSATQNTSAIRDILLIKRSTANSGGTSTGATAVPHDTNSSSATATALSYTANPTLGTTVGTIRATKYAIPSTNPNSSSTIVEWLFGDSPAQAIVLRGTSQVLAVNLNGITTAGGSFNINFEWTEE